jgi:hypothetical protein
VADRLGIPHYVIDAEARFRAAVMQDFADSYAAGQTPVPCVRCNQSVKFGDLIALAGDLGAEAMATGHYVRRVDGAQGAELHRAVDEARDQSWFLFATTQQQLGRSLFPLGDMPNKDAVRAEAAQRGCGGGTPASRTTHLLLLPRSKLTSIPLDEVRHEGDAEQSERWPVRASDLSARFLHRPRRLRLSTLQPRRQDRLLLLQLRLQRLRTQKGFLSVSDGRRVRAARRARIRSGGEGGSGGGGRRP